MALEFHNPFWVEGDAQWWSVAGVVEGKGDWGGGGGTERESEGGGEWEGRKLLITETNSRDCLHCIRTPDVCMSSGGAEVMERTSTQDFPLH